MSQIYQARRRVQDAPAEQKFETSVPGPSMQELAAGTMPSTEQMGRRVDLPDAIREKMEASFGADFSGVKLYESQTVADAGAEAMTMGSNVAFAPGQLDLTSTAGQALLGHELSHVVSRARGESAGRGFLADAGLEAQADRQGMLAAQGESVYTGPVSPLSASAVPASAAGVAQAKKKKDIAKDALSAGEIKDKSKDPGVEDALQRYVTANPNQTGRSGSLMTMMGPFGLGVELLSRGYRDYVMAKLSRIGGDTEEKKAEQDELLRVFLGDDKGAIAQYIGNDMSQMTQSLGGYQDLVSEDFKTRANAYAGAQSDNQLRWSLDAMLDKHSFLTQGGNALDSNLVNNYRQASATFQKDRELVEDSLNAATGKLVRTTPQERKAHRRGRREALNGVL